MLFALREWERNPNESRISAVTNRDPDSIRCLDFKDQEAADRYATNQQIGGCHWQAIPASVQEKL